MLSFSPPKWNRHERCSSSFWKRYPHRRLIRRLSYRNISTWEHWYKMKHTSPDVVPQAVYGLKLNRDAIASAQIVCQPRLLSDLRFTAFTPLAEEGHLKPQMPLIADCKSGVSRRRSESQYRLAALRGRGYCKAYGITGHRHQPEVRQTIATLQPGIARHFIFVPIGTHDPGYTPLYTCILKTVAIREAVFTRILSGQSFCGHHACPVQHPKPAACAVQTFAVSASKIFV